MTVAPLLPTGPAAIAAGAPPTSPAPSSETASSGAKTFGLVFGVAGIAGLAVGGIFGAKASSAWNTAQHECPSHVGCSTQAITDHNSAFTFATVSTAGFIAGGVLLAGGLTLYLAAPKGNSPTVGLQAAPGGLAVSGGF